MSDEKMDYINDDINDDTKMSNTENVISKKGYINTYNTFSTYLYNEGVKGIRNIFITEFLRFINDEPSLAIPMLLWIDTFHDFKRTRGKKTKDESLYLITSINNVLDFYIRNKKYNKKILIGNWVEENFVTYLNDKQSKNKNPLIYSENKHYSISKCFRDSFFDYTEYNKLDQKQNLDTYKYKRNDDYTTMAFYPFHEDVKNTVLKPCYEWDKKNNENYENKPILQHKCARILYQLSLVVYDTEQPFEPQLLYTYILYNFLKSDNGEYIGGHHISEKLEKSVFTYIPNYIVKYYAKDVDTKKTTSVLEDAKLIILPASLFDKNRANSSDIPGNFANIPKTIIPYDFEGKSFIYNYVMENDKDNRCTLTVKTPWDDDNKTNLQFTSKCNNQSISSFTSEFKNTIIELSKNFDDNTELKTNIDIIPKIEDMIKNANNLRLSGNVVKDGFSVEEISIRLLFEIINNIINNIKNNNVTDKYHLLSPYCFDKYMSLKRVGDFGQILQCKQLGIPLITDDNMQILLSIACCSSVIWTPSDRLLYYNGESDCFYHYKDNICSIERKQKAEKKEYKTEINTNVLNKIGQIDNKNNILSAVTDFEEKYSIYTGKIYIQPSFEEIVEEKLRKEKEEEVQKTIKKIKKQEDLQKKNIEYENKELERKNILKKILLTPKYSNKKKLTTTDSFDISGILLSEGMTKGTSDTELNELKKELLNNDSTVLNLSDKFNSINSEEDISLDENKKRKSLRNILSPAKKQKQKIVTTSTLKGRRKYKNRSGPGKKYKRYITARKSKSRKNK